MKSKKVLLLFLSALSVAGFFCASNHALAATEISGDINSPTVWKKENSPYIILNQIEVNASLTIEAGTIIKFGARTSRYSSGISVHGLLTAIGNPLEKIILTSTCDYAYGGNTSSYCTYKSPLSDDWYGINMFNNPNKIDLEYVKILYASDGVSYQNTIESIPFKQLTIKNSEISNCGNAGIHLYDTMPVLESNILSGNYSGLEVVGWNYDRVPKIRNSSIFSNRNGIMGLSGGRHIPVDARYNWWGDRSGPYYNYYGAREANNIEGKGNRIVGTLVLFRPWDQTDPTIPKEAVIFVPGVGASLNPDLMISGIFADNWTMFDHTYDGIIKAFQTMGYVEGKNFFIAYYDWRKSNSESAEEYLKPVIQKALNYGDATKVNIVTHSMGSLVARSYVQSDEYANDVDNLIMIAPPNKGSSDVYTAWEGGRIPNNWNGKLIMKVYLSYLTATTSGTTSFYETIHKYIPSLKELMPVYDFIHPAGDSQNLKNYLTMNEKNDFLLGLNSDAEKLNQRTRFSIILGDKQPTVNKIPTINSDKNGIWLDGKPDPIDPEKNDSSGDGEVLISSADVTSAFRDVLDYGHSEIVSKSEKIVAERLGDSLDYIYDSPEINDELDIWTDAPANIVVTDPNGQTVSADGSNIDNSAYAQETGEDGFKIISIPNPIEGDYHIGIIGNDDGSAHIGIEYGDSDGENNDNSQTIPITIGDGESQDYVIRHNPKNRTFPITEIKLTDKIAPEIKINSPISGKEYFSNEKLEVNFEVTDNVSESSKIQIVAFFDDMPVKSGDLVDLSTVEVGPHSFILDATDEAGNLNEKIIDFVVAEAPAPILDTTTPSIKISSPTDGRKYFEDEKIPVKYEVSDDITLSENIKIEVLLDDEKIDSRVLEISGLEIGEHKLKISALDEAGNSSQETVSFSIIKKVEDPPPSKDIIVIIDKPIKRPDPVDRSIAPPAESPTAGSSGTENGNTNGSTFQNAPQIVVADNSQKKKHHKKKKPKKPKIKIGIVKKSSDKIRIISSTRSVPVQLQSVQEVLGVMVDRNTTSDFVTDQIMWPKKLSLLELLSADKEKLLNLIAKIYNQEIKTSVFNTITLENDLNLQISRLFVTIAFFLGLVFLLHLFYLIVPR